MLAISYLLALAASFTLATAQESDSTVYVSSTRRTTVTTTSTISVPDASLRVTPTIVVTVPSDYAFSTLPASITTTWGWNATQPTFPGNSIKSANGTVTGKNESKLLEYGESKPTDVKTADGDEPTKTAKATAVTVTMKGGTNKAHRGGFMMGLGLLLAVIV